MITNTNINNLPNIDETQEENAMIDYANKLAEDQKDRIADEVIRLVDNMDQIANDIPIAVVPEVVFTNYFLRFFFDIATGNKETNTNLLIKWLELAGGWYHAVNIINSQGKVIFTVPSLYQTGVVDHSQLEGVNFTTIGRLFECHATRTPEEGVNVLGSALASLPKFLIMNVDKSAGLAWRRIFLHYGLLIDPKDNKKAIVKSTPQEKIEMVAEKKGRAIIEDLGIIED